MQFKISALLLLASSASVLADLDSINDDIDNLQSKVSDLSGAATSIIGNIEGGASTLVDNIEGGASTLVDNIEGAASTIVSNVKDFVTSVAGEINLPTITIAPPDVEGYFSTVENELKDLPKTQWDNIKTGLYPTEVSQWVASLPTELRAEASSKLTEWADDLGSSAANSNSKGALALGAAGVAGVLAVVMAL